MPTKAKPWPRNAEYTRLDVIALAGKIERSANELIQYDHDPLAAMRELVLVKDMARDIQVKLNEVKE